MAQKIKLCFVLTIIGIIGCSVTVSGQDPVITSTAKTVTVSFADDTTTGPTSTTTVPTSTTTVPTSTTTVPTSTTTVPTSTTTVPTSTTTASTSTTTNVTPTTTKATPTTTKATTTTTVSTPSPTVSSSTEEPGSTEPGSTEKPTTTTLPPPVTPEKKFPDNVGNYRPASSCIILDGAFEIVLAVKKVNNDTKNETLVMPEHAYAESNCGTEDQELTIYWPVESKKNSSASFLNKAIFKFRKTKVAEENNLAAKQSVSLTQVSVSFPPDQFDGYSGKFDKTETYTVGNLSNFETTVNSSYSCNHEESIIGITGTEFQFQLNMANLHVEAYRGLTNGEFSPSVSCKADHKRPSKKGLIVGLSVTFVVLIVGAAAGYYIWRRRQHAGYQRMDS